MTKSFINTKHGHWGHRTTSDLRARKAGCVTKGIPLITQPWGERRGALPHVTIPIMGIINPGQTRSHSPGSHGPELRCSPGPTGWVCCLAWPPAVGIRPCSLSAGTRGATKSRAPQRKCEHRLLRRERKVQTDHCSSEASCLGTATDRKLNLLSQARPKSGPCLPRLSRQR